MNILVTGDLLVFLAMAPRQQAPFLHTTSPTLNERHTVTSQQTCGRDVSGLGLDVIKHGLYVFREQDALFREQDMVIFWTRAIIMWSFNCVLLYQHNY